MKIVYSCWGYNNKKENYLDNNLIYLSLKSVKKHGYRTLLYTDEKHYDKLKNFEFDEIRVFNQKELDFLPHNVWCLGKVLAFSLINEPFLHFDFDVIMIKDLIKPIINNELICFHPEPWRTNKDYEFLYKHALENFPELKKIFNDNLHTYNCAIIGGHAVNAINHSAKLVLEYCKNHKNYLEEKQDTLVKQVRYWELPVFLEQVVFVNLSLHYSNNHHIQPVYDFKSLNLKAHEKENWDMVYKIMFEGGLIHLWGYKKFFSKEFIKFIEKKTI
jgi:hypothetical protein